MEAIAAPVAARAEARSWPSVWALTVWAAMGTWSAALVFTLHSQFSRFGYQKYDLGNMVQAVWSTAQGRPLEVTLGTGEQSVRLASHVDPILVVLAPLWMVAPSPVALATAQVLACAFGALPVFWLGRRHLGSEAAGALAALTYLVYPWLVWSTLDAIHPVTLAIPMLLFAIWFLDTDRLGPFAACAVLVAACGELMGLPIAMMGIWYWLSRGRRHAGVVIFAAGLGWTIVAVKMIVPFFLGLESQFYGYYGGVGGSPEGILRSALTNPATLLDALATRDDLLYWALLCLPLAGAFFLSPLLLLGLAPHVLANGLSSVESLSEPRSHHASPLIPFLIAATVMGLGRLPAKRRMFATSAVLLVSASASVVFGPWPGIPGPRPPWLFTGPYGALSTSKVEAMADATRLVPAEASVSTTNKLGSRLSARRHVYSVPLIERAEWVLLDANDPWVPLPTEESPRTRWGRYDPALVAALARRLSSDRDWRKVFEREGVVVFRRAPA